ncbi:hypothetical protein NE237_032205 [Protea cynaroides]|uniref:Cation efflux protein cytoplasmic domain-containing protein n=1 Tax=Protea cynaroides TaxID=273540 RepID=A0A9Q0L2P0_9MAGN|nr:hypothetical protein NE237_032205 [Protea cynaroides]
MAWSQAKAMVTRAEPGAFKDLGLACPNYTLLNEKEHVVVYLLLALNRNKRKQDRSYYLYLIVSSPNHLQIHSILSGARSFQRKMARELGADSSDYRTELLSPTREGGAVTEPSEQSWRLHVGEFRLPEIPNNPQVGFGDLLTMRKKGKIAKYYKRQEELLKGYGEMETMHESGCLPGSLTEGELKELAKSEQMAIYVSNLANLILFIAKVYASIASRSLAVIASTLDSLLDLLSGFILWFTDNAMRKPNHFWYPIGKKRMQPVGIIVFASVMATLGLQILLESARELVTKSHPNFDREKEKWMIGIMVSVTVVKFALMVFCRRFNNEIVRAYAQDHLFDVITNSTGLVTAVLAVRYYWWIDPTGAILIALYTMGTWAKTVMENVWSLIGRTAPPNYLSKLTYLIWNHHEEIKHIDTVRAYTFGSHYFVEVDVVLPEDMPLHQAHNIGETLQEKLEQLPEVERAFVHIDFEWSHKPEHKTQLVEILTAYKCHHECSCISMHTYDQWYPASYPSPPIFNGPHTP